MRFITGELEYGGRIGERVKSGVQIAWEKRGYNWLSNYGPGSDSEEEITTKVQELGRNPEDFEVEQRAFGDDAHQIDGWALYLLEKPVEEESRE